MISLLVAMDRNRGIGVDNKLPWHLPADLAYFKRITMGHPIVMGRKTHESIGRALPGRDNIILTRNKSYSAPGCRVIHSMQELEELNQEYKHEEIFLIGGADLFEQVLHTADRLYLTYIDEEFASDTFFPPINQEEWKLISKEKGIKDEKNPYDYDFIVYERADAR
jgi:dihydrofolate reductase